MLNQENGGGYGSTSLTIKDPTLPVQLYGGMKKNKRKMGG
jgi:hypothetical protein